MTCERCHQTFPGKKGRFCGTCQPAAAVEDPLVAALADVLSDLLAENAHQLVGGAAFAKDALARINAARSAPSPRQEGTT